MLEVCEIFRSISGEADWQGYVCTFIRFSGCDVDCAWCDTVYAREEKGKPCSVEELVSICHANRSERVILTGGEPLLQAELPQLCLELLKNEFRVQLETSGTRLVNEVPKEVQKVIDIKPPSARAKRGFHWGNLDLLEPQDEIKIVLAERADYDWALRIMQKTGLERNPRVLLSPVAGSLEPAVLAEWMIQDNLICKLQVQLHRIIWPEVERGK
ncbi:7-carboxy-7-deazaguanine synthase QueE [bacterium]|nr:7-carboxy-7-deazaguanine synthase QueE [bacterium]